MYDPSDNIDCYIFNLSTYGVDDGYIVYEANTDDPGTLEYGYGKGSKYFINNVKAYQNNTDSKLIFMGGRTVLYEKSGQIRDLASDRPVSISKSALSMAYNKDYSAALAVKTATQSSVSSASVGAVQTVAASLPTTYDITNIFNFTPATMGSLGSGGNCSPAGCTNLVAYYQQQRGISGLMVNSSFQSTYNVMIKYVPVGTTEVLDGLKNYCIAMGHTPAGWVSKNSGYTFNWFQTNLNNNHMLWMSVVTSSYAPGSTGNHALNACGYTTSGGIQYFRVIDQWDNSVSHFYRYQNGAYLNYVCYVRFS